MKESFGRDLIEKERSNSGDVSPNKTGKRYRPHFFGEPEEHESAMESDRADKFAAHSRVGGKEIAARGTKEFSDNFTIVKGFLRGRVGKSWNQVYSEIRQSIDARSMRGNHALEHLVDDFVVHDTLVGDDGLIYETKLSKPYLSEPGRHRLVDGFYIHPETAKLEYQHVPKAKNAK